MGLSRGPAPAQATRVPIVRSAAARMDTEIFWLLTDSTLPATSQDRKRTVVDVLSENGPVYVGLDNVGVVPSVV